ncbi:hypothetical protein ACA910_010409 [Epithemia clementina (nom. ined.)]
MEVTIPRPSNNNNNNNNNTAPLLGRTTTTFFVANQDPQEEEDDDDDKDEALAWALHESIVTTTMMKETKKEEAEAYGFPSKAAVAPSSHWGVEEEEDRKMPATQQSPAPKLCDEQWLRAWQANWNKEKENDDDNNDNNEGVANLEVVIDRFDAEKQYEEEDRKMPAVAARFQVEPLVVDPDQTTAAVCWPSNHNNKKKTKKKKNSADEALARALQASLDNCQEEGAMIQHNAGIMEFDSAQFKKEARIPRPNGNINTDNDESNSTITAGDANLAHALRESLTLIEQQHLILEEQQMSLSPVGRAWKLVERVVKLQQEFVSATTGKFSFKAVAVDDMVPMAETLIATQEQYQNNGTPDQVDIGYHWTLSANLARIQTDGLLTKHERTLRNIQAPQNGSAMGDGIYTASDPYSFCGDRFGPICILVARLKGNVHESHHADEGGGSNTLVNGPTNVLKTSGQCIPLLYFESELIRRHDSTWPGNLLVYQCHVKLQAILDSALNRHHHHNYYSEKLPRDWDSDRIKAATVVPKILSAAEAFSYFGEHSVGSGFHFGGPFGNVTGALQPPRPPFVALFGSNHPPAVAPPNPRPAAAARPVFPFGRPNPPVVAPPNPPPAAAHGQFQFGQPNPPGVAPPNPPAAAAHGQFQLGQPNPPGVAPRNPPAAAAHGQFQLEPPNPPGVAPRNPPAAAAHGQFQFGPPNPPAVAPRNPPAAAYGQFQFGRPNPPGVAPPPPNPPAAAHVGFQFGQPNPPGVPPPNPPPAAHGRFQFGPWPNQPPHVGNGAFQFARPNQLPPVVVHGAFQFARPNQPPFVVPPNPPTVHRIPLDG